MSQDAGNRRRIQAIWERSKPKIASDYAATALVGAIVLGTCLVSPLLTDPAVLAAFVLGVLICVIGIGACWNVGAQETRRRRFEAFMQARRTLPPVDRCLSCDYEIASLRTEPDGCRVCPECGAAWRGVDPAVDPP